MIKHHVKHSEEAHPPKVHARPVEDVPSTALVAALVALIGAREGGTSRDLNEAREEAQRLLKAGGYKTELPRY